MTALLFGETMSAVVSTREESLVFVVRVGGLTPQSAAARLDSTATPWIFGVRERAVTRVMARYSELYNGPRRRKYPRTLDHALGEAPSAGRISSRPRARKRRGRRLGVGPAHLIACGAIGTTGGPSDFYNRGETTQNENGGSHEPAQVQQ